MPATDTGRHSLKRVGTALRHADARQGRPETTYTCTCRAHLPGTSRRQAHDSLLWHRQDLRDDAALAAARR